MPRVNLLVQSFRNEQTTKNILRILDQITDADLVEAVNTRGPNQSTIIHVAAKTARDTTLSIIFRRLYDIAPWLAYHHASAPDANGNTPLHYVAMRDRLNSHMFSSYGKIINLLYDYGARPTCINDRVETPYSMKRDTLLDPARFNAARTTIDTVTDARSHDMVIPVTSLGLHPVDAAAMNGPVSPLDPRIVDVRWRNEHQVLKQYASVPTGHSRAALTYEFHRKFPALPGLISLSGVVTNASGEFRGILFPVLDPLPPLAGAQQAVEILRAVLRTLTAIHAARYSYGRLHEGHIMMNNGVVTLLHGVGEQHNAKARNQDLRDFERVAINMLHVWPEARDLHRAVHVATDASELLTIFEAWQPLANIVIPDGAMNAPLLARLREIPTVDGTEAVQAIVNSGSRWIEVSLPVQWRGTIFSNLIHNMGIIEIAIPAVARPNADGVLFVPYARGQDVPSGPYFLRTADRTLMPIPCRVRRTDVPESNEDNSLWCWAEEVFTMQAMREHNEAICFAIDTTTPAVPVVLTYGLARNIWRALSAVSTPQNPYVTIDGGKKHKKRAHFRVRDAFENGSALFQIKASEATPSPTKLLIRTLLRQIRISEQRYTAIEMDELRAYAELLLAHPIPAAETRVNIIQQLRNFHAQHRAAHWEVPGNLPAPAHAPAHEEHHGHGHGHWVHPAEEAFEEAAGGILEPTLHIAFDPHHAHAPDHGPTPAPHHGHTHTSGRVDSATTSASQQASASAGGAASKATSAAIDSYATPTDVAPPPTGSQIGIGFAVAAAAGAIVGGAVGIFHIVHALCTQRGSEQLSIVLMHKLQELGLDVVAHAAKDAICEAGRLGLRELHRLHQFSAAFGEFVTNAATVTPILICVTAVALTVWDAARGNITWGEAGAKIGGHVIKAAMVVGTALLLISLASPAWLVIVGAAVVGFGVSYLYNKFVTSRWAKEREEVDEAYRVLGIDASIARQAAFADVESRFKGMLKFVHPNRNEGNVAVASAMADELYAAFDVIARRTAPA